MAPPSSHPPLAIYISGKILLVVTCTQKSYLSCGLKLELITTYHLGFIVKLL